MSLDFLTANRFVDILYMYPTVGKEKTLAEFENLAISTINNDIITGNIVVSFMAGALASGLSIVLCFYHPYRPTKLNGIALYPESKWTAARGFAPNSGFVRSTSL